MAKLVATEAALANATDAMRIHGAFGYSTEGHIEPLLPRRAIAVHWRRDERDSTHSHRSRAVGRGRKITTKRMGLKMSRP